MLLLGFNLNTNIQVSPSKWGGIPHIVVTKLYFQLARIQLITKSELSTAHPSRCKTYRWVKTPPVTRGCFAHPLGCKSSKLWVKTPHITRGCSAHPHGCKSYTQQLAQLSTAKNKSRSRAPKSPYTGQSKSLTTGKTLNNLSQIPLSSWNPQYASWAPAPLTPHNCYNTQSNTLTFIRNIVHTNQCHTVTRYFPNEKHTQQPPGHRTYLEYETRGKVGKIGPTDKYNSHHVTKTASQKYENYLREYNLHRNKCIDIIRTAFQDIRDELKERESQRKNNTTSRTSQYNVNTEIDQTSDSPHQVTDKNYINHKLNTPDTNPFRANTLNTRQGTVEAPIGLDRQDISWYMKTQSYHAYIHTQNTLNTKNRLKPDHNSVGSKYSTQQTQTKSTSNGGENRLRQSQLRPAITENEKTCTHTCNEQISTRPPRHGVNLHTTKRRP